MNNAILVIHPYRSGPVWVFDDATKGLKAEVFVTSMSSVITKWVKPIPNAEKGFTALFSDKPFPGSQHKLVWLREGDSGNWYRDNETKAECWLCGVLLMFFKNAPKEIYVQALPKT